jgi:hypothetical protein
LKSFSFITFGIQERKAARKMFKGSAGKNLKRNIVEVDGTADEDSSSSSSNNQPAPTTASVHAGRGGLDAAAQAKIKEAIGKTMTLEEVARLQRQLEGGVVPGSGSASQPASKKAKV